MAKRTADAKKVDQDRLLDVREVCEILGLSEPCVRRLVARNQLPALRPFGLRRLKFREADIQALVRGERPAGLRPTAAEERRP